jgi:hypothetical protein
MNTLITNIKKYFNILFTTVMALVTVGACLAGMTALFNQMSLPGLAWYNIMLLIIGNCFLGYFGLLIIYLYIHYIIKK